MRLKDKVAIVVGGGNIFRGLAAAAKGMDRNFSKQVSLLQVDSFDNRCHCYRLPFAVLAYLVRNLHERTMPIVAAITANTPTYVKSSATFAQSVLNIKSCLTASVV